MKNYLIGTIVLFLAFILQMAGCRDGSGMLPPITDPQAQETKDASPGSREAGNSAGSFFDRIAATAKTTAEEQIPAETTGAEEPADTPATMEALAPTEPVYVPEPTQPVYTEPEPVYVEPMEPPTQPPTEPEPVIAPPTEAPTETVHVHSWEPVYSYIHHDAEYVCSV